MLEGPRSFELVWLLQKTAGRNSSLQQPWANHFFPEHMLPFYLDYLCSHSPCHLKCLLSMPSASSTFCLYLLQTPFPTGSLP